MTGDDEARNYCLLVIAVQKSHGADNQSSRRADGQDDDFCIQLAVVYRNVAVVYCNVFEYCHMHCLCVRACVKAGRYKRRQTCTRTDGPGRCGHVSLRACGDGAGGTCMTTCRHSRQKAMQEGTGAGIHTCIVSL